MKCREDLPSCVFVVKVGLDLRYLDEEQLLVVCVERNRVDVPEYVPIDEVADQANHSSCLLRVNVCLSIIKVGPIDWRLLLVERDFCVLWYSLIWRNEFVATLELLLGFLKGALPSSIIVVVDDVVHLSCPGHVRDHMIGELVDILLEVLKDLRHADGQR